MIDKLKLTQVSVIRKTETIDLYQGLIIYYYGNNYEWIDHPKEGVIEKSDSCFIIKWSDTTEPTKIDNSEFSNNILKKCGF